MKLDKYTVGARYGKALFELAQAEQQTEPVYQELMRLRAIFQEIPEIGGILTDNRLEPDQKAHVVQPLLENFDGIVHNFIGVVYNYNRMNDIPLMIAEYERRYDDFNGVILGKVTTAVPLAPGQKEQIAANFAQRLGYEKAELAEEVDESIIGGVIVEANYHVVDGSLKTQLAKIHEVLKQA